MRADTLVQQFQQQIASLHPEIEAALRTGHRVRIALYKGDDFVGEPVLTVLPSRKVDKSATGRLALVAKQ